MSTVTAYRMNPPGPMTVEALRDLLKGLAGDAIVVLARDAEENDHKPLLETYIENSVVTIVNGVGYVGFVEDGAEVHKASPTVVLVPYD